MKYEIEVHAGSRVEVDEKIFQSWAGKRWLNGRQYWGPVKTFNNEHLKSTAPFVPG